MTEKCTFFTFTHVRQTCFAYNFFCVHFFTTFSTDSKSAWNSAFFDTFFDFLKKKVFKGHNSTFFKLWRQTRKKRLKKSKNLFCKCVLDFNFAPIKGSVFFLFKKKVKFVVPYCPVIWTGERDEAHSFHCYKMAAWQVWLNIFKWYNLTRGALNHLFQLKAFWDDFVQAKSLSVIFQSWESKLKKLHQFWLKTSPNCSSLEDDFKQLVSWNPLFRYTKLTFWRHQITERYLSWPCQFQLAVSWNWPGPQ